MSVSENKSGIPFDREGIGKMGFGLFGLGCRNKTPLLIKRRSVIVKTRIAQ